LESISQHVASNSEIALKVIKSPHPEKSVPEDQNRPAVTDQIDRVSDRTVEVIEALTGGHERIILG
jgi:hypothetical protein